MRFSSAWREKAEKKLHTIKSEKRSLEWLAARVMLSELLHEEKIIKHTPEGRPQLSDKSYHISISHSGNHAAILLHPQRRTGIDIETRSNRILRVSQRFVSEKEYIDNTQKTLHLLLHWSAKETLFKLMHASQIDFKTHLLIEPFRLALSGEIRAHELKTKKQQSFRIFYEIHPLYVLTWALE